MDPMLEYLYLMISDTKCSHHVSILSFALQSENREASMFNTINSRIGLHHWPVLVANFLKNDIFCNH